jgi:hypothetical protein
MDLGVTGPVTPRYSRYDPMNRPNLVRQRFLAELNVWLTPGLLYHCFTGESDPETLAHVQNLDPALQEPLLAKAERQWPERLEAIAAERRIRQEQSKAQVRGYVRGAKRARKGYNP